MLLYDILFLYLYLRSLYEIGIFLYDIRKKKLELF